MAGGNQVLQSGTITPGHAVMWTTDGVVQDAGPATAGLINELGITNNGGVGFAINSDFTNVPFSRLSYQITTGHWAIIGADSFCGASQLGIAFSTGGPLAPSTISWVNNAGGPITWVNNFGQPIVWSSYNVQNLWLKFRADWLAQSYADDTAASLAGVEQNGVYRTGSTLKICLI